jgi:hypothetical protein
MGTFAETAIVDYRLLFADQEKQTSVFRFRMQQNKWKFAILFFVCKNKRKLLFSVSSIFCLWNPETWRHGHEDMETWRCGDMAMETWKHGKMETGRHGDRETHGDMDTETSNGKRKTDAQAIFRCRWLIVQTEFVVCPFADEETN